MTRRRRIREEWQDGDAHNEHCGDNRNHTGRSVSREPGACHSERTRRGVRRGAGSSLSAVLLERIDEVDGAEGGGGSGAAPRRAEGLYIGASVAKRVHSWNVGTSTVCTVQYSTV